MGAGEFEDPPRRLHVAIEGGKRMIGHGVEIALCGGVDDERELAFGKGEAAGVGLRRDASAQYEREVWRFAGKGFRRCG